MKNSVYIFKKDILTNIYITLARSEQQPVQQEGPQGEWVLQPVQPQEH
jgi:hypothetical protein